MECSGCSLGSRSNRNIPIRAQATCTRQRQALSPGNAVTRWLPRPVSTQVQLPDLLIFANVLGRTPNRGTDQAAVGILAMTLPYAVLCLQWFGHDTHLHDPAQHVHLFSECARFKDDAKLPSKKQSTVEAIPSHFTPRCTTTATFLHEPWNLTAVAGECIEDAGDRLHQKSEGYSPVLIASFCKAMAATWEVA